MRFRRIVSCMLMIITLVASFAITPSRAAAATLEVTSTRPTGAGSLKEALDIANRDSGTDTIRFRLSGNGPWTITIDADLYVTNPVIVDGTSQPGFGGANRVYIEGGANVQSIFTLVGHGGTYIQGLGLYNYGANGVTIWKDASWNFVDDNYIGFKPGPNGNLFNIARAQYSAGIGVQGSYNKIRRNTIAGVYNGINLGQAIEYPDRLDPNLITRDNVIEANRIGTDPAGQTTVGYGNKSTGIFLGAYVQSSWIGGYNVVAGHEGSAIEILHPTSTGNRVYYNYLGVNDGGTAVIRGSTNNQGILFGNGAKSNGAWGNIIAGNRLAGVLLTSADGNWIWNNTIGLNSAQTQVLGTQNSGITLNVDGIRQWTTGSVRNSIQGNMIAGQAIHGIEMYSAVGNGVYNNWIGTNSAGAQFGNRYFGVYLEDSSYNTGDGNAWGPNGYGRVGVTRGTGNDIR